MIQSRDFHSFPHKWEVCLVLYSILMRLMSDMYNRNQSHIAYTCCFIKQVPYNSRGNLLSQVILHRPAITGRQLIYNIYISFPINRFLQGNENKNTVMSLIITVLNLIMCKGFLSYRFKYQIIYIYFRSLSRSDRK